VEEDSEKEEKTRRFRGDLPNVATRGIAIRWVTRLRLEEGRSDGRDG